MFDLFKQDVQRWVIPQQIADPSKVTFPRTMRLLFRHMPLQAMLWFRLGTWCRNKGIRLIPGFTQWILYLIYGLEIRVGTDIGGGFYIAHPIGTVIVAKSIGRNCTVVSSVTMGMRNEWAFPEIGDNVFVGAGARILGGIKIGDGASIGANAVVLEDVPANATAVGIPAKVIKIKN
jgi:serine O-acetyltransferase